MVPTSMRVRRTTARSDFRRSSRRAALGADFPWFSAGQSYAFPQFSYGTVLVYDADLPQPLTVLPGPAFEPGLYVVNDLRLQLAAPANQYNRDGDEVNLAIDASSPQHPDLHFSASGLPPGLSIDPTSGVIGDSINEGDYQTGRYDATISVNDGVITRSAHINWQITDSAVSASSTDSRSTRMETRWTLPATCSTKRARRSPSR